MGGDGRMKNTKVSSRLRQEPLSNIDAITKHLRILSFFLFASCLLCLRAYGQTDTGAIVGTITDSSGASVPNATVTLTNVGTNAKTLLKTDKQGTYIATSLKIGNYAVHVHAEGFKEVTRNGIVLNVQDRLPVDFTLQVG